MEGNLLPIGCLLVRHQFSLYVEKHQLFWLSQGGKFILVDFKFRICSITTTTKSTPAPSPTTTSSASTTATAPSSSTTTTPGLLNIRINKRKLDSFNFLFNSTRSLESLFINLKKGDSYTISLTASLLKFKLMSSPSFGQQKGPVIISTLWGRGVCVCVKRQIKLKALDPLWVLMATVGNMG